MALKGIDVSKWQGTIDWSKVKDQVDFAIIRAGYGTGYVDPYFKRKQAMEEMYLKKIQNLKNIILTVKSMVLIRVYIGSHMQLLRLMLYLKLKHVLKLLRVRNLNILYGSIMNMKVNGIRI